MAAAAAVFGITIGKHAAAHHLLDIDFNVFIYKTGMETLKLFPVVLEYLNKPVFVVNWQVVYHGYIADYSII